MNLAPIVLFVYNRLDHTRQTIEALQKNDLAKESELYIYSDAARDKQAEAEVDKVRDYIKTISGFKYINIVIRKKNWGMANSIVDGVTHIVNEYGKIIVVEDDIVTSPWFLNYMNDALTLYEDDKEVMHIAGYLPEAYGQNRLPNSFFLRFMSCWGWATWKDSWSNANWDAQYLYDKINTNKELKKFNLNNAINFHQQLLDNTNGSITTWAIKWFSTIFICDGLCLYPYKSLVRNIGLDGSGVHSAIDSNNTIEELLCSINLTKIEFKESSIGKKYLMRFYKYGKHSSFKVRIQHNLNNFRNQKVRTLRKMLRKILAKP